MVPLYLALMIGHEKTAAMAVGLVARRLLRLVPVSGRIVFYGHAHYATDLALVCLIVLLCYGPGRTYLKGGVLMLFYIRSGTSYADLVFVGGRGLFVVVYLITLCIYCSCGSGFIVSYVIGRGFADFISWGFCRAQLWQGPRWHL